MAISLVTRAGNGAPLTANQFDSNMSIIQTQVNLDTTAITTKLSTSDFNTYFEGLSSGKQIVSWLRVSNKPAELTERYCFKALASGADQTISASASTIDVRLDSTSFNTGGAFDTAAHQFVAAVAGYYQLNFSIQVQLVSGSPSAISILAYAKIDGAHILLTTLDNAGTGTRIYRGSSVEKLNVGSLVNMSVDFTFTGTATWSVSGISNPSTSLSGFLIMPT